MKLFMIFHVVCLSLIGAKVHSGGCSFTQSGRSDHTLKWIATTNECLMNPSKHTIKCINCAYSYNCNTQSLLDELGTRYAFLMSEIIEHTTGVSILARWVPTDVQVQANDIVWLEKCFSEMLLREAAGIDHLSQWPATVSATVYFVNKVVVAVSRGCSGIGSCRASMGRCVNSGYGIAKLVCKSCCNEDGGNYWGDEHFYGGSIMTPETQCSKSMSEVQEAMNLPVEDNAEGKCNNN